MRVDLFDFDLPDENIALRPASPRDHARFLVVRPDADPSLEDHHVYDLPSFLKPGDALVFNDTKVIPAQLEGIRHREGGEEIASPAPCTCAWRPTAGKPLPSPANASSRVTASISAWGRATAPLPMGSLVATVAEKGEAGEITLAFDLSGPDLDQAIATVGHIPLPPYIAAKRPRRRKGSGDYQTIYAREEGAVAAPTAGLHFTPDLFAKLDAAGVVERHFVTLHVGAGTFLPVKADDTAEHKMHEEIGYISPSTAAALNAVRAPAATASSPSAPPRYACSKVPQRRVVTSPPGRVPPASSSRPATASRRWIC